jgi:DNA invertase Pin-like site-specific DNA recombinase
MSGKSMERPGLADLIAYARKGDTLAVVRLDRLGRSLAELLVTVEKLLCAQGMALLSLEEKSTLHRPPANSSSMCSELSPISSGG